MSSFVPNILTEHGIFNMIMRNQGPSIWGMNQKKKMLDSALIFY